MRNLRKRLGMSPGAGEEDRSDALGHSTPCGEGTGVQQPSSRCVTTYDVLEGQRRLSAPQALVPGPCLVGWIRLGLSVAKFGNRVSSDIEISRWIRSLPKTAAGQNHTAVIEESSACPPSSLKVVESLAVRT